MSIRVKDYKFFRSLSVKVNDNWPLRKAEQLWRQLRTHKIAEIEAAEACKWLRATGFPQYAQMYEDMQFPIDVSTAAQDHPLLEPDVLHSLYRRLQILNSCSHIHQHRATNTQKDEPEDEFCALSDNWTYQREVRRWSRVCTEQNAEELPKKLENVHQDSKDEVFEKSVQSPRERLRRTGSSKFRRRREGVFFSERDSTSIIEPVSQHLTELKICEVTHVSDSEITPRHQRRSRTKSFEKTEAWTSPTSSDHLNWKLQLDDVPTAKGNQACSNQSGPEMSHLSAIQLQVLRKLALLKLTSHMEKYCPSHRTGWNWDLSKFMIKLKTPAYRDKNVFGVPLTIILQRTGQVLPRNIEEALRWLQQNAADQVGIFRKPGVKSRIQQLRNLVEVNQAVDYSDHQCYDVADMVKQYFRDLPETLLTYKLSETFILIFQYVPPYLRREAVLCALLLMPDEHLQVLQALLHFLLAITKNQQVNQMNESNLAMCFAPTLFHYTQIYKQSTGCPHSRELEENQAGHDCLVYFLKNAATLFMIPQDVMNQCKSTEIKETRAKPLSELGIDLGGWKEYLNECEINLLKEARERPRGWFSIPNQNIKAEISYKKVADGLPLRLWKICTEVDASPLEVMNRILRERHIWDQDLHSARIVSQLDPKTEIFQYVRKTIEPLPNEEFCILRTWKSEHFKDACMILETSVEHQDTVAVPNTVRGIVLTSRYLIESCGPGKSRVFHFSRVDLMGKTPEWYQKNYGYVTALFLENLQNSFIATSGSMA